MALFIFELSTSFTKTDKKQNQLVHVNLCRLIFSSNQFGKFFIFGNTKPMLFVLIIIEALLFLLLLLLLPIKITVDGIFSIHASRFEIKIAVFGIKIKKFAFRLFLFQPPLFTFQRILGSGKTLNYPMFSKKKKKKPKLGKFILNILKHSDLNLHLLLGVKDDSAITVLSIGALSLLIKNTFRRFSLPCSIGLEPVFNKNIFRVKISGIIRLNPANIIEIIKK